jgi:hypothetical protein
VFDLRETGGVLAELIELGGVEIHHSRIVEKTRDGRRPLRLAFFPGAYGVGVNGPPSAASRHLTSVFLNKPAHAAQGLGLCLNHAACDADHLVVGYTGPP